MLKKIMIVAFVIILWEGREVIFPAIQSVVTAFIETGSSVMESV